MANPFFNASFYLANNPDLYLAGLTDAEAEAHYLQYGAQEGVVSGSGRDGRPNPWFNPEFYLLNNPDLITAGLTVSDALNHYAQYGVLEGRAFSPQAALDPASFDYLAYATKNADLQAAFGITDLDALTPEQQGQLLSHFLAYGHTEGREGAGPAIFVAQVATAKILVATDGTVTMGTTGDDTFTLTVASDVAEGAVAIQGLTGNDTLEMANTAAGAITVNAALTSVENIVLATGSAALNLIIAGSSVQTVTANPVNFNVGLSYAGSKFDSITLNGNISQLGTAFTNVSGSADALAVNVKGLAAALTLNGIEQLTVNQGVATAFVAINASQAQGSDLSVTVTGGKAEVVSIVVLDSTASPNLVNVTLDGSAALGDQMLSVEDSLKLVNATVVGGVGADQLNTKTAAGHTAILNAGAGDDFLSASEGQDIMTGGAGTDKFIFTAATAKAVITDDKITAVDTVTDFTAAHQDAVSLGGVVATASLHIAIEDITVQGMVKFSTGWLAGKDLTAVVAGLSEAIEDTKKVVFDFGGDAYVFVADATAATITGDALIKLAGVNASELTALDTGVYFTANIMT